MPQKTKDNKVIITFTYSAYKDYIFLLKLNKLVFGKIAILLI